MRTLLTLVTLAFLTACSSGQESATSQPQGSFTGRVVETMDAGGYTYVALGSNGQKLWAAGPQTPVEVGQELTVDLGMKMEAFHSESLNRTFDAVYFVSSLGSSGAAVTTPAPGTAGMPHPRSDTPTEEIDAASIELPSGGHRIADLWQTRADLAGTQVTVRGRVVKVNPNVMGKTFLHLQDGTGSEGDGTHDLTVTSAETPALGDVVTIRGTVVVDKDFGAGYKYGLLLEEASIQMP